MFGVFYGGPGSPAAEFSKKSHRFFLGFRVIERLIRFLEQLLESSGILREQGNADAGRTDKIVDLEARQTRQRVAQPGVVRQILHQHNKFVAAEPASCPKLTRGKFQYDFGDEAGYTPLLPMFTLGHNFAPAHIHAGGLRYHGAGVIVSQLLKDNLMEAVDIQQLESFEAGCLFAQSEGIIPAPESSHAIAAAIREANKCKETGEEKVILFNLSGHGLIDMASYDKYLAGDLVNYTLNDEDIQKNLDEIGDLAK